MTRILIVDDDAVQARVLARAFMRRKPDLQVLTSANGAEATDLMGAEEVDLVLTDLMMPEMDGFELIAWLMKHRPWVHVFTMTAFGTGETVNRLSAMGSVECFTKPLDVKDVLSKLMDTLGQSVRGHVRNVSLASFLQLMEMERKTCSLAVRSADNHGILFVRKGQLIDAQTTGLRGEGAAVEIVAWPDPNITIMNHCPVQERAIQQSLGFIIMEGMRLADEAGRYETRPVDDTGSVWPLHPLMSPRPSELAALGPAGRPVEDAPKGEPVELPSGASALALVDTATGVVRRSAARDASSLDELARMAAAILRSEVAMFSIFGDAAGVQELVLSTRTRCDLIRPHGAGAFALLVFEPEETTLAMARFELDRFLAACSAA